jgi:hypothetical protein
VDDADQPERLSEADLEEELGLTPLQEAAGAGPAALVEGNPGTRMVVPRKGKIFDEDGLCEIVVIRPCVSRGKRIRGLPPIYTPKMLEANASVYTGWLQYMDHLTEKIIEELLKEGRSIKDLGGRIIKSWWDPSVRFTDDAKYGFQPGGVVARALPQPDVRRMLEADPEILNVSHNAWPTGAVKSKAPWDATLEGYLIEGIRSTPEGSVDWVPRGGAGGRLRLQEWETFAVSVLGATYGSPRRESEDTEDMSGIDLTKISEQDLRQKLLSTNPSLAEALGVKPETPPERVTVTGGLTEEALNEALRKQAQTFEARLTETTSSVEERARQLAEGIVEERESAREVAKRAKKLIESAGLPSRWQEDLLRRYSVLPSGPSTVLETLMGEDDVDAALTESVNQDVQHARDLIEEVGGVPSVSGLGGSGGSSVRESKKGKRSRGAFREFLAESEPDAEKRKKIESGDAIKEMVAEGIADVNLPAAVED